MVVSVELSLRVTENGLLLFPRTIHHQHLLKHQRLLEYHTRIQAWQPCNGLISMAHCIRDSITKTTATRSENLLGITALLSILYGRLMPSAVLSSLVHLSQQWPDIPMRAITTHWCVSPISRSPLLVDKSSIGQECVLHVN